MKSLLQCSLFSASLLFWCRFGFMLTVFGHSFSAQAAYTYKGFIDEQGRLSLLDGVTKFFTGPIYFMEKFELPEGVRIDNSIPYWCIKRSQLEKRARSFQARIVRPDGSHDDYTVQVPVTVQLLPGADGMLVFQSGNRFFKTSLNNPTHDSFIFESLYDEKSKQNPNDHSGGDGNSVPEVEVVSSANTDNVTALEGDQSRQNPPNDHSGGDGDSVPEVEVVSSANTDNVTALEGDQSRQNAKGHSGGDGHSVKVEVVSSVSTDSVTSLEVDQSNQNPNDHSGGDGQHVDSSAQAMKVQSLENNAIVLKIAGISTAAALIAALAIKMHNKKRPNNKISIIKYSAIACATTALATTVWYYW